MINNWLQEKFRDQQPYTFQIIDITEKAIRNEGIITYFGECTLNKYRNLNGLKKEYSSKTREDLIDYLTRYVFPTNENNFTKNVKQGDIGEILTIDIIEKFRNLKVPIYKMRWKFNNNKSVFCTDIFAHNNGAELTDLKYYEVKTKRSTTKIDELGINAYNSLKSDIPNENIADFISRYYTDKAETLFDAGLEDQADMFYDIAAKYDDIVQNPSSYNRSFEIVLIVERKLFKEDILVNLNDLPPEIEPLEVTVILIDDLKKFVEESYDSAIKYAINMVCGDGNE